MKRGQKKKGEERDEGEDSVCNAITLLSSCDADVSPATKDFKRSL